MEQNKLQQPVIISSSPHLHSGATVSAAMRDVILALLPAAAAAVYYFGTAALGVMAGCCLAAVLAEALCRKIMRRPQTVADGSAFLTGLLLAFCLPPALSPFLAAFGAVCAIVIGKQVFGGLGANIFNPAHIGRAILLASFPAQMTTWTEPFGSGEDAVTSATPLVLLRDAEKLCREGALQPFAGVPDLSSLFWGNTAGSLGETCVPALLAGGVFLIARKHIDWRIPVYYIGTVALICFCYGLAFGYTPLFAVYHVMSGGLIIGAFFMATDWVTSPVSKKGRIVFAIGLGIITALIRLRGGYIEGVCYSILIMNMVTPLIDRYIKTTPLGGGKRHV